MDHSFKKKQVMGDQTKQYMLAIVFSDRKQ